MPVTFGPKVTGTQGSKVTGTFRPKVTGTHKNTRGVFVTISETNKEGPEEQSG